MIWTERGSNTSLFQGWGTAADFEGIDVSGKYVLVRRGEITFEEKSRNAAEAGATGNHIFATMRQRKVLLIASRQRAARIFLLSLEDGLRLAELPEKILHFHVSVSFLGGGVRMSAILRTGVSPIF